MSMDTLSSVLRELDAACPCIWVPIHDPDRMYRCHYSCACEADAHGEGERGTNPCEWSGHALARKLARVAFVAGVNGEDYAGGKLDAALDVEGKEE